MQTITMTLSAVAASPVEATLIGIGAVIAGPPVVRRLTGLIREFWGPKVTRLRRVIAERVAPTEPPAAVAQQDEEIVHLRERA